MTDTIVFQIETLIRLHYLDIRDEIKEIKTNYNKKNIKIDVYNKKWSFIGTNGIKVNGLISKLNNAWGGDWKIEFPDKLLGRIYSKNKSGKLRPTIIKDDLPLSSPFSSLENEKMVHRLSSHVEEGNTVLITMFRDTVKASKNKKLKNIKGQMGQNKLNFMQRLEQIFPNKTITLLEWPDIYRSSQDTVRSSHPLVSYLCRAAAVISKGIASLEDLEKCQGSLTAAAHNELLTRATKKWTILGDETGSLNEFRGKGSDYVSSKMCWIAIPPNTNLNPLDPDYHCSGPDGSKDYTQGINSLYDFDSIMMFTFEFEEGSETKSASKIVSDPHLSFWMDSLPLVLEKISQEIEEPIEIDIFIEQVGPLQSGIRVIEPLVAELRGILDNRRGWNQISFSELWVISKGEHPWIGYADLLGAIANNNKSVDEETAKRKELVRSRIRMSPFRQSSLKSVVIQALRETARPLEFLKGLSSISVEDQWDYIRVFFSEAIREATSALKPHEWQDLNKHMKESAANEQGQKATQLIIENIDLESALEKLSKPKDRFELFMTMMGTANHMGDTESAFKVSDMIEDLREEPTKYEPGRDRLLTYHNLFAGTFDNVFHFDYSIESLNRYLPSELEYEPIRVEREEDAHYLGSKIVALGLRNLSDDVEQAIDISDVVRGYPSGDDAHLARHFIYLAELFMQQERNEDAFDVLRSRIEESCSFSRDTNYSNGYYLASMLKASCLTGKGEEEFRYAKDFVIKRLKSDSEGAFPSQRIAYWFTIWAQSLELIDQASEAITYLESMVEKNWKAQNVLGVIISCELLDLKHRGLTEIDAETYLENVLENSHERTRKWVDAHKPSEEDWLAPLNFNYR